MVKELFLTSRHTPHKDLNPMHTYVSLQYDTQTKELKLVDEFEGKKYEYSIGTAELVEDNSEEQSGENNG